MEPIPYRAMLLWPTKQLPVEEGWGFEPKMNGYRMLARVALTGVTLMTRHGNNFTDRYPDVVQQLPIALDGHQAILDGEMVGHDDYGREDFNELSRANPKVTHYIFDLLELDGVPLVRRPLSERRQLLDTVFVEQSQVKRVPMFDDHNLLEEAARELGFEGVVAKRLSSRYQQGRRSRDWQKRRFEITETDPSYVIEDVTEQYKEK